MGTFAFGQVPDLSSGFSYSHFCPARLTFHGSQPHLRPKKQ